MYESGELQQLLGAEGQVPEHVPAAQPEPAPLGIENRLN
jgi:hypothetical protein